MSKRDVFIITGVMLAVTVVAIWKASCLQGYGTVVQAWVTVFLVLLTAVYVRRVAQQANASVEMARETKDARFAALKPIVMIDWTSGQRGRAITPYFKNIGLGPALNVKCYCTHTKFEFKGKQDRTTLEVGKREQITLLTEEFDFGDWPGFAINCDYQSIYGENFRSILRFKTEQERYLEISELK